MEDESKSSCSMHVLDKTYMTGIKGDTGTQGCKVKVNEQIYKYTDFYLQ
jgi:hypothetical protein